MKICIFCGASDSLDPQVEFQIKKVMTHFAKENIELVYGGAAIGIMGGLANELLSLGGRVTGVIPKQLMINEVAHPGLTQLHVVSNMHERKQLMYNLSDAFLIFPGGMGTLDEMFEILTWRQIGIHTKPIGMLNINNYFQHLLDFLDNAVKHGLVKQKDRDILYSSEQWHDIWSHFKAIT